MKIVVCIKQVPDTSDIKWSENNTIIREGVESILNPYDSYALELALKIKDKFPSSEITALTMGPHQAKDILKRAIATGADRGILLSDKKFAGADTQATSKTLSAIIKNKFPDVDLIICGQFAIDGDTAQTGPSIAAHLNFPQLTYVKELVDVDESSVTIKKETDYGSQTVKMMLPGVLCVTKNKEVPRKFTIKGTIKAYNTDIETYSLLDTGLTPKGVGISGSPTYVSKAFRPQRQKECEFFDYSNNPEEITNIIAEKLSNFI